MMERVLVVGHGSIGKRHLQIVREALPEADIRVLRHKPCSDTPEFADGCFSNLAEACAFSPQATVLANPAPFHVDTATALADAGSHLLVEKPLSHNMTGVPALLKRVRERNLILQVGYNLRFLPSLEQFRNRLHAGEIGRVLSIHCEIGQYLPAWRPGIDYRQSVSARSELGGGVLLELSHELDYLRWIFGEVAWVSAWLGRQSSLEVNVEDVAHLMLGFMPDATGRATVASLSLDFIRHDTTRVCVAIGESGSLRWNGLSGTVEEFGLGVSEWHQAFRHPHKRDDSFRAQFRDFLVCIESGGVPPVTGDDGLAVLRIVAAARQSAAAGCVQAAVEGAEDARLA